MLELLPIPERSSVYNVVYAKKKSIGTVYMEDDGDFVYMPSEQGYFNSATLDAISAKLKQMNKLSLDEIFRRYNKPKDE